MKRLIVIVIAAAGSFLVSMCGKDDLILGHVTAHYEGFVLDSATLAPVESVKVTAVDTIPEFLLTLSDSTGFFDLHDKIGNSELPLFFRKAGYTTAVRMLTSGQRTTIKIQQQ